MLNNQELDSASIVLPQCMLNRVGRNTCLHEQTASLYFPLILQRLVRWGPDGSHGPVLCRAEEVTLVWYQYQSEKPAETLSFYHSLHLYDRDTSFSILAKACFSRRKLDTSAGRFWPRVVCRS
jgi:hypothetical protein